MSQCLTGLHTAQTYSPLEVKISPRTFFLLFFSKNYKSKQKTKMVDAGPRVAIALWISSVAMLFAQFWGIVNVGFMAVWSLTGLIDKTLKLVSRARERRFTTWLDQVVRSFCGRTGPNDRTELPIFRDPERGEPDP